MTNRMTNRGETGMIVGFIIGLFLLAAALLSPTQVLAEDTSPTLTAVYSDIGEIGNVVIPAVEVPTPPPFRPLVVAGSVTADSDSVGVAFEIPEGVEFSSTKVAAAVVPIDTVIEDPADIVAQGVLADIAPGGGPVAVTIPVVPQEFERTVKIVFVGIRYDPVKP